MKKNIEIKAKYYIYTDGGARGNPGPAAYGFVIYDANKKVIYEEGKKIGFATNNTAEYTAVISALDWIGRNIKDKDIEYSVFMDSNLVVNQLLGKFKVKDENLRNLFYTAKNYEEKINSHISYFAIPREKNKEADRLVNMALDARS